MLDTAQINDGAPSSYPVKVDGSGFIYALRQYSLAWFNSSITYVIELLSTSYLLSPSLKITLR